MGEQAYSFKDIKGPFSPEPLIFSSRKLGRKAVKRDSRTLRLGNYLTAKLPAPPASCDWTKGVAQFGMMMNDQLGCCTIAGAAHAVQVFSLNVGVETTLSDADVLAYYKLWDGYVAGNPSTDNGGVELDVLNHWQKEGFAGHVLDAFADVSVASPTEVRQAVALFGGLYIGIEVPNYVMQNMPAVWDVVPDDLGIDGGHCVFVTGYDSVGPTFISWGAVYKMTWAFWNRYVDEAHALLSADFLNAAGLDPAGFDLAQLQADLALIR